jgi:DNA polymerase-3 subunit delta
MAADTLKDFEEISKAVAQGKFAPVYFLHGEEPYFIDQLSHIFEHHVLSEAERGFNQMVCYGKDVDAAHIANAARRFPMMAPYQVIIVKEAQEIKNYDALVPYFQQPLPSTILVICYKNKKFDKRTKAYTALKKCVVFESNKLYANQIPAWITSHLKKQGVKINDKACAMLSEYIGNDLARITGELDKILINKTDRGSEISLEEIEQNVGISKEFNIFELQAAIGQRNSFKAYQIAEYITRSKDFSLIPFISNLFSFFSKLYIAHHLSDKSKNNLMKELGINYFFADDYLNALRNYSPAKLQQVFQVLKTYDLKSKGIGNNTADGKQLLQEIIYLIVQEK